MLVTYTNRKGDLYYLHVGKTKTGKNKYFFSKKKEGVLALEIPEGYENVNAQVFLRKIQPKIILDQEIAMVESELRFVF